MKKETMAQLGLLLIALIWGFAFVAVDYALINGWQTFTILALRGTISALLLLPFAIKGKFWKDKKMIIHSVVAGIFFFFGYAFQTLGQAASNVVNSAFYTCLYVVFTPFIALFFGRHDVKKKTYLSAFLAILGIFTLNYFAKGAEFSFQKGDIYLILCAIMFSFQIIWLDKFIDKNSDPLSASFVMLLTMGLLSLFGFGISGEKIPSNFKGFEGVLFAAIFSSGVCSILQFVCQKHTTASKTSLIVSLETTFACIFAWIVGTDEFNWFSLIGLLLIMSSVVISNVSLKKKIDLTGMKFILLDADDTILDFQKSAMFAFKKMLKHYQVKYKRKYLKEYHEENNRLWRLYEKGEIPRKQIFDDRLKTLVTKYNLPFNPVEASYLYLKYLSLGAFILGNSKEELARLSQKYDLYLVSNGEPSVQYPRLEKTGIKQYFKKIYVSEEIGYQKPYQEFFEYVANDIKDFDKDKAIIIGDSLTSDIKGGINYGIKTCWFNPKNKKSDLKIDYIIKDLSEIK